jgi:O-6-methylguanine DNA methyltransferase
MTRRPEADISPEEERRLRARLRTEADPGFLARLRSQSRARHARQHRNLGWFDIDYEPNRIRVVHDGDLIHLVTNDGGHFRDIAGEQLGYVPEKGEAEPVRHRAEHALAGEIQGDTIAYLGELPSFHRHVLEATARIPRGEVRPYAWVARLAGNPAAVRAAGTALAHNPVPFIVPCHRVVKSDFELGRYSAAGGTATKERVLGYEGLRLARLAEYRAKGIRYLGHGGEAFCYPGCGGTWEPEDDFRTFHNAAEALALGYEPCEACRPL